MTQFAVLTETMVREALDEQKGELVVERAPEDQGKGWIITFELDGIRSVVITERTLTLRVFKEAGSAITFIERNNPGQMEIRVLRAVAKGITHLRLPPRPEKKSASKQKSTKNVQKPKGKRT